MKKKTQNIDLSKIGENISKLMDACGVDASELSKQTGLPTSTISRLRSNTSDANPNLASLLPLADFFRVTISQLIGEEPIKHIHGIYKPTKIKKISIPVLKAENIIDYLTSNENHNHPLIDIDIPTSSKTFAYLMQGNAMEPQFSDKTLLIIDPELEVENLDHVLALPKGKKLPLFRQALIDGDEIYLRALNPTFNEFTKITSDSHQILGVMVQSRRNFKDVAWPLTQTNSAAKIAS